MADTSADVPGRYDIVINGHGYMLLQSLEPSLPFRTHRATYGSTPTFLPRQNVGAAYGDNQQDFWMTLSQSDWSLGEDQKFFRINDEQSKRRYWAGTALDRRVEGQISIRLDVTNLTAAANTAAMCAGTDSSAYFTTSTTLYSFTTSSGPTSKGAHGLGAAPSHRAMVCDPAGTIYMSTTAAGSVGVRKYSIGGASFASFSASGADVLCYLNNTLYGLRQDANCDLVKWDTAGNLTSLFTWKGADGTANTTIGTKLAGLCAFGGKLAILTLLGNQPELWVYDGTGVSLVARLPKTFAISQSYPAFCEAEGVLFIGGRILGDGSNLNYPAIYYYANGNIGLLYKAAVSSQQDIRSLESFNNTIVWADTSNSNIHQYDLATGGVAIVGSGNAAGEVSVSVGGATGFVAWGITTGTAITAWPTTTTASTATMNTSLFDGDSSLTKYFRSVKFDADIPTGASVDLGYQLNDCTGSYTSTQVGAVAGTEYSINQSARTISIQATLHKGSSTTGPVFKRLYIQAAPILTSYKQREYILDLSGIGFGMDTVHLADGTSHPLSGFKQAQNLNTFITTTAPVSVTDVFGTFTAMPVPDQCEIYHTQEGWDSPTEPGCYVAKITLRQV